MGTNPNEANYGGLHGWYVDYNAGPATTTTAASGYVPTLATPAPAAAASTVTGIDPAEVAAATYGKIIAMWVGGQPRIGGTIIYGPTLSVDGGGTYASYGVSFGYPFWNTPGRPPVETGSRELKELRLDGYKVWSLADGYLMSGLTFRFYPGTETQGVDPLITAAYPLAPVAMKGQCLVFLDGLNLTPFAGKVPFVSALIADTSSGDDPTDGMPAYSALTTMMSSRYINMGATEFAATRDDADYLDAAPVERYDAVIVAESISPVELLGRYARLHLWDIVQTDKLRVFERGTTDPDITLDLSHIVSAGNSPPILIERKQHQDIPQKLEYTFIDIDRDYEYNIASAKLRSDPAPATVSRGTDTIALPSVHTIFEATAWVTLRRMKDEIARETVSFTTNIFGYAIEPGDIVQVDAGFKTYYVRVLETLKGANWTNKISGEPVLRCGLGVSSALLDGVQCVTAAYSLSRKLLSVFEDPLYILQASAGSSGGEDDDYAAWMAAA